MKFLIPIFLLLTIHASATNYYVSATGSDGAAGTSPGAAWQTIAKVNSFAFAANDVIHFKCGETFYGSIIVSRNNLTFTSYGTGAKPTITGFITASSWTSIGGGIYECTVNAKNRLNIVSINGIPQQIGRYPNADAANGGYLTYESFSSLSITDNQLSTSPNNWTGAEVAIRKNGYCIDRGKITNHSGGTLTYAMGINANSSITPQNSSATANFGYFIMNDVRTLDQFGEWYFDSTTNKLDMYFGASNPASYTIQVSGVDSLINLNGKNNIVIRDLNLTGGNMSSVYGLNTSVISVRNCDINNIGARGIQLSNVSTVAIDSINTNYTLSNAIQIYSKNVANVTVRNCTVKNNGLYPGMGSYFEDIDYKGMHLSASTNLIVEYNTVDSVGLAGIQVQGNDVFVRYNKTTNYCAVLHDNGGIYTYQIGTDASPGTEYSNRWIYGNIVGPGIGNPYGTTSTGPDISGIYLDGRSGDVTIFGNTVYGVNGNALQLNNPKNVYVYDNLFYNNTKDITFARWDWGSITNLNVTRNISFCTTQDQYNVVYTNQNLSSSANTTVLADLNSLGLIDSNYYHSISNLAVKLDIYSTVGTSMGIIPYSLTGFKSYCNYDHATNAPAVSYTPYVLNTLIGTNLFSNSNFTSNISGITTFGTNVTSTWDNTSAVNGTGSLRMNFSSPQLNRYGTLYTGIGAVSSGKKYILRYTTKGTSLNGLTRAYISKTASPFTELTPIQSRSFGTEKQTHEYLFSAPTTDASARFMIEIAQTSGTTYVDDIQFYEADATENSIDIQVKFLYNDTKTDQTYSLGAKYAGVDSTIYNGTITLSPFTSKVMVLVGSADPEVPYVPAVRKFLTNKTFYQKN